MGCRSTSSAMVRRWTFGNRRPDEEIIARAQELQAKNKGMTNAQAAKRVCMETRIFDQAYTLQAKRAAAGLA